MTPWMVIVGRCPWVGHIHVANPWIEPICPKKNNAIEAAKATSKVTKSTFRISSEYWRPICKKSPSAPKDLFSS